MVAFSVAVALQMNRHGRPFMMIHKTSTAGRRRDHSYLHHHVYFYNPACAGSWTTSTPRLVGYCPIRAVHPDPVQSYPVQSCPVLSLATPCPTKNPPDLCCSHGPAVDCSSFAFALPT